MLFPKTATDFNAKTKLILEMPKKPRIRLSQGLLNKILERVAWIPLWTIINLTILYF